jgi:hypothetical protein
MVAHGIHERPFCGRRAGVGPGTVGLARGWPPVASLAEHKKAGRPLLDTPFGRESAHGGAGGLRGPHAGSAMEALRSQADFLLSPDGNTGCGDNPAEIQRNHDSNRFGARALWDEYDIENIVDGG